MPPRSIPTTIAPTDLAKVGAGTQSDRKLLYVGTMTDRTPSLPDTRSEPGKTRPSEGQGSAQAAGEIGGPEGPEPTRYGDWQIKGRVSDF